MEILESVFESRQAWVELCNVLSHRALHTTSPNDQLMVYLQLAEAREAYLEDFEGASLAYQHVIHIDPEHIEAYDHLDRLLSCMLYA